MSIGSPDPHKLITLEDWFRRHAQIPLRSVAIIVLILWLLLNAFSLLRQEEDQKVAFSRLIDVTSLALAQHNRVLIESVLESAQTQLGGYSVAICRNGEQIVAARTRTANCIVTGHFWLATLSSSIPGFAEYHLILRYNRFKHTFLQLGLLGISLGLVGATMLLLRTIKIKIARELVAPLSVGVWENQSLLICEFEKLRQDYLLAQEDRSKAAAAEAVMRRNQQIAHDIRSPLSALNLLANSFSGLRNAEARVFHSALQRIREIADGLISTVKRPVDVTIKKYDGFALITNLIEEKKVEYSTSNIRFTATSDSADPLLLNFDQVEMARVLSNLLNNAVEAIDSDTGNVGVGVRTSHEKVSIIVSDDGKGMDRELVKRVGERGVSFGKAGTGLGLYHARQTVERQGGRLRIHSKPGVGTQVSIELPAATLSGTN